MWSLLRRCLKLALGLYLFLLLLAFLSLSSLGLLGLPLLLALAWIPFLFHTLPAVQIAWEPVLFATVCVLLLGIGVHGFLGWIVGAPLQDVSGVAGTGDRAFRTWKARWTISLGLLAGLLFIVGVATTGISLQTTWLLTGPEPMFQNNFGAFRQGEGRAGLKRIGEGVKKYHDAHHQFPPGGTGDSTGRMFPGWQAQLLPYIGLEALFAEIHFDRAWDAPENRLPLSESVEAYLIPFVLQQARRSDDATDRKRYGVSHYAGNCRVLRPNAPMRLADIVDGASNTLLAGEAAGNYRPWGHPLNLRDPAAGLHQSPDGFGGPWGSRSTNFLYADGSVHGVLDRTDPAVLRALSTPAGHDGAVLERNE